MHACTYQSVLVSAACQVDICSVNRFISEHFEKFFRKEFYIMVQNKLYSVS